MSCLDGFYDFYDLTNQRFTVNRSPFTVYELTNRLVDDLTNFLIP